jgi:hypothetical protein
MKLGTSVLLEIVAIVQEGLFKGTDISDGLRELDVDVYGPEDSDEDSIELSDAYVKAHPRATEWDN